MSDKENLAFPIPNSILEPYIKNAVSGAIIGALGGGEDLIKKAIEQVLNLKVDSSGNVNKYTSDNKFNLIEIVSQNAIKTITIKLINEMVKSLEPDIKKSLEGQIKRQHREIARVLVDKTIESLSSSWAISVSFKSDY